MMSSKLAGSMDPELVKLIDNADYFGPHGAIAFFKEKYLKLAKAGIRNGELEYPSQYINVLYSASSFSSRQPGMKNKVRTALFLLRAAWWAGKVCKLVENDTVEPGRVHLLMSVDVRMLQALKRFHVLPEFVHRRLIRRIQWFNGVIMNRLAGAPKSERHTQLASWSLLCELEAAGLYTLPNGSALRDYIIEYVKEHRETTDRDTAQLVARFARALGDTETAVYVAKRTGNKDQLAKAR